MGAALSIAIYVIFGALRETDTEIGFVSLVKILSSILIFFSFFIPFLHGNIMLMYKHHVYQVPESGTSKNTGGKRIVIDFFMLVIQAVIFICMGIFIDHPVVLMLIVIILLAFDIMLWLVITNSLGVENRFESNFLRINFYCIFLFIVILTGYLLIVDRVDAIFLLFVNEKTYAQPPLALDQISVRANLEAIVLAIFAVISIIRTFRDYVTNIELYQGTYSESDN